MQTALGLPLLRLAWLFPALPFEAETCPVAPAIVSVPVRSVTCLPWEVD